MPKLPESFLNVLMPFLADVLPLQPKSRLRRNLCHRYPPDLTDITLKLTMAAMLFLHEECLASMKNLCNDEDKDAMFSMLHAHGTWSIGIDFGQTPRKILSDGSINSISPQG